MTTEFGRRIKEAHTRLDEAERAHGWCSWCKLGFERIDGVHRVLNRLIDCNAPEKPQ